MYKDTNCNNVLDVLRNVGYSRRYRNPQLHVAPNPLYYEDNLALMVIGTLKDTIYFGVPPKAILYARGHIRLNNDDNADNADIATLDYDGVITYNSMASPPGAAALGARGRYSTGKELNYQKFYGEIGLAINNTPGASIKLPTHGRSTPTPIDGVHRLRYKDIVRMVLEYLAENPSSTKEIIDTYYKIATRYLKRLNSFMWPIETVARYLPYRYVDEYIYAYKAIEKGLEEKATSAAYWQKVSDTIRVKTSRRSTIMKGSPFPWDNDKYSLRLKPISITRGVVEAMRDNYISAYRRCLEGLEEKRDARTYPHNREASYSRARSTHLFYMHKHCPDTKGLYVIFQAPLILASYIKTTTKVNVLQDVLYNPYQLLQIVKEHDYQYAVKGVTPLYSGDCNRRDFATIVARSEREATRASYRSLLQNTLLGITRAKAYSDTDEKDGGAAAAADVHSAMSRELSYERF